MISELCVANSNRSDACIVVMAEVEKTEMEEQLRTRIGKRSGTRIVCRTGEPASLHDLGIVNAASARAIAVLGEVDDPGGDADVVKAVLATLVTSDDPDVPIVVEIGDAETAATLREAGAGRVHCVRAADVIARITAQACRQSGLSAVCQELLDSRDVELAQATGADDFIVSDAVSSYMMAQLSENPELDDVFTDLFDAEGSAIGVKPAAWYVRPDEPVPFTRVAAAARARSEVAIGYRLAARDGHDAEVLVNPVKSDTVRLGAEDQVVVIGPPE